MFDLLKKDNLEKKDIDAVNVNVVTPGDARTAPCQMYDKFPVPVVGTEVKFELGPGRKPGQIQAINVKIDTTRIFHHR